jgi:hypothetical protein
MASTEVADVIAMRTPAIGAPISAAGALERDDGELPYAWDEDFAGRVTGTPAGSADRDQHGQGEQRQVADGV